jgi:hypothetical protein
MAGRPRQLGFGLTAPARKKRAAVVKKKISREAFLAAINNAQNNYSKTVESRERSQRCDALIKRVVS